MVEGLTHLQNQIHWNTGRELHVTRAFAMFMLLAVGPIVCIVPAFYSSQLRSSASNFASDKWSAALLFVVIALPTSACAIIAGKLLVDAASNPVKSSVNALVFKRRYATDAEQMRCWCTYRGRCWGLCFHA